MTLDVKRNLFDEVVKCIHQHHAEKTPFDPNRVTVSDMELLMNNSKEMFMNLVEARVRRAVKEYANLHSS